MASEAADGQPQGEYFRLPGVLMLLLVPFGMGLLTCAALLPQLVPYDYLGPLGAFTLELVKRQPNLLMGMCVIAWGIHLVEACFSLRISRSKNLTDETAMKWFFLTLMYGMFALKKLVCYDPQDKEKVE